MKRTKTYTCTKCREQFSPADLEVCTKCNHLFCPNHIYTYVDGNNRSITLNSLQYCEACYKETYK
jgi:hypothetical protein